MKKMGIVALSVTLAACGSDSSSSGGGSSTSFQTWNVQERITSTTCPSWYTNGNTFNQTLSIAYEGSSVDLIQRMSFGGQLAFDITDTVSSNGRLRFSSTEPYTDRPTEVSFYSASTTMNWVMNMSGNSATGTISYDIPRMSYRAPGVSETYECSSQSTITATLADGSPQFTASNAESVTTFSASSSNGEVVDLAEKTIVSDCIANGDAFVASSMGITSTAIVLSTRDYLDEQCSIAASSDSQVELYSYEVGGIVTATDGLDAYELNLIDSNDNAFFTLVRQEKGKTFFASQEASSSSKDGLSVGNRLDGFDYSNSPVKFN